MGVSAIDIWDTPLIIGSNLFSGPTNATQLTVQRPAPRVFGRDKVGIFNNVIVLFDMAGMIASGEYIESALVRFTAAAVDTGALTADACLLPTTTQQHQLDTALGGDTELVSGDCAWWQTIFGLGDYSGPTFKTMVSGSNVLRPSLKVRMRDSGGGDLFSFNYVSDPNVAFRLNQLVPTIHLEAMGERFTVTAGGTLGDVTFTMNRVGASIFDSFVEVYSGETLVATSDLVPIGSLSTSIFGLAQLYTFTGIDAITIVSGTELVAVMRTTFVPQAGTEVGVFGSSTNILVNNTTTSTGLVALGSSGGLSGPRYVSANDLPHLYKIDGAARLNDPFGLIHRTTVPAFAVSGSTYDVDIGPVLQQWVSSEEMGKVRADIVGVQLAIPADANTDDDREREWSDAQLIVNHRPRRAQFSMQRGF